MCFWKSFLYVTIFSFAIASADFTSFTGKISRNNVRLRLNPSIDSPIIQELDKEDMVVVVDECHDFYTILPPSFLKAYVYKSYVSDGCVEGNRVNVRLDPHLESPVLTQLSRGDQVDGKVSPLNSKWLEISPPKNMRLYIAKEFIENIGNAEYLQKLETKRLDIEAFLTEAEITSQEELDKPFPSISIDALLQNLKAVSEDGEVFANQAKRAHAMHTMILEKFLEKKLAYLETKTQDSDRNIAMKDDLSSENYFNAANQEMAHWVPIEMHLYKNWAKKNDDRSLEEFYEEQEAQAIILTGVIQAYERPVHKKPGDYLLVNRVTNLPIAYLYSTKVALKNHIGQEVTLKGLLRPNNDFAYPAYFVLSIE